MVNMKCSNQQEVELNINIKQYKKNKHLSK